MGQTDGPLVWLDSAHARTWWNRRTNRGAGSALAGLAAFAEAAFAEAALAEAAAGSIWLRAGAAASLRAAGLQSSAAKPRRAGGPEGRRPSGRGRQSRKGGGGGAACRRQEKSSLRKKFAEESSLGHKNSIAVRDCEPQSAGRGRAEEEEAFCCALGWDASGPSETGPPQASLKQPQTRPVPVPVSSTQSQSQAHPSAGASPKLQALLRTPDGPFPTGACLPGDFVASRGWAPRAPLAASLWGAPAHRLLAADAQRHPQAARSPPPTGSARRCHGTGVEGRPPPEWHLGTWAARRARCRFIAANSLRAPPDPSQTGTVSPLAARRSSWALSSGVWPVSRKGAPAGLLVPEGGLRARGAPAASASASGALTTLRIRPRAGQTPREAPPPSSTGSPLVRQPPTNERAASCRLAASASTKRRPKVARPLAQCSPPSQKGARVPRWPLAASC